MNDLVLSSAKLEQVFILFSNKFDKQIYNSKDDYIEKRLLHRYKQLTIAS